MGSVEPPFDPRDTSNREALSVASGRAVHQLSTRVHSATVMAGHPTIPHTQTTRPARATCDDGSELARPRPQNEVKRVIWGDATSSRPFHLKSSGQDGYPWSIPRIDGGYIARMDVIQEVPIPRLEECEREF